jgi:hypothetical protein
LCHADSENESDNEEIPDLGKKNFIEPDVVQSSDNNGGKEMCHCQGLTEF